MSESALPMALFEVTKGPQRENRAGLDPAGTSAAGSVGAQWRVVGSGNETGGS